MTQPLVPVFRNATAADIPAIVTLVEAAYRGDSGRRGWTTESELLDGRRTDADAVAELLDSDYSRILLAEVDGHLLASAHVAKQGQHGYFGMFAVDPAQQGSGIGRAVLAQAECLVRQQWGCSGMRMTVIEQRPELIAWYQRRGYHRTGQYQPFPYGDERFGIPRRGDLRFEVLAKNFVGEAA